MDIRKLLVGLGVTAFYTWPMLLLTTPTPAPATLHVEEPPAREATIIWSMIQPSQPLTEPLSSTVVTSNTLPPNTEVTRPVIATPTLMVVPEPASPQLALIVEPVVIPEAEPVVSRKTKRKRRRRNRYANCHDNNAISVSSTGFVVERSVIDYYAHITRYRKLGHVSWHESDTGYRDGFKVRRINCDLREAGIRNGDIVNTINGTAVQTIPQAIRLWFRIRRSEQIVLEITRRGAPLRLYYELAS